MKSIILILLVLCANILLHAQTYPTPQSVPFSQHFGSTTFSSFPAGFTGLQFSGATASTQTAAEASLPTVNATIATATGSQTTGGLYGYSASSNGKIYIQTSSNGTNGANQLVMAFNSGSNTSIIVDYSTELINNGGGSSTRSIGISAQYRASSSSSWTSISGSAVTYNGNGATPDPRRFTLTLSGLTTNTDYYFRWVSWRGAGGGNSLGAAIDSVVVSPAVINTPSIQAYNISFGGTAQTQFTITVNKGDGSKRIIKIATSLGNITNPVDGTDPSASTVFSGDNQVVYNGSDSVVTVTGLSANTTYFARVYEYNGISTGTKFNVSTATNNPNSATTLAFLNSTVSDIIIDPGFTFPTDIAYNNFQETTLTAAAVTVGQFVIRDGGASSDGDALSTTLTALTFSLSNSSALRRVAIFDGTSNIAEVASGATLNFSALSLAAADNSTKIFQIKASFVSAVTDNTQFQLIITSASADASGSTFVSANAGGASTSISGTNNMIEVTATKLKFVQQPSGTELNAVMSPAVTIEATDTLNNRDIDRTGTVNLLSTGVLSGTVTASLTSGLGTFGTIVHTATGNSLFLKGTLAGLDTATSNSFNIFGAMTELVIPRYFGAKNSASSNTQRTPIAICLSFNGLLPDTAYSVKLNLELTSVGGNTFGAGNLWNKSNSSWNGNAIDTLAFSSNSSGESGPVWLYFQATGNNSRFGAGQVHNLRVAITPKGTSFASTATWVSTNTITSLDILGSGSTSADSTDDGAFLKGNIDTTFSGKFVLLYDNVTGTGMPLFSTQVRSLTAFNSTQTTLPVSIDSIWLTGTTGKGQFAAVIPSAANNATGVKRIEFRNTDNTVSVLDTSFNGVWNTVNDTKTLYRKGVVNYKFTYRLSLGVGFEGIGFGSYQDTVTTELYNALPPYNLIASTRNTVASRVGKAGFTDIVNGASYYLAVRHRNSVETWSANPISFNGTAAYNFTTSASQAFGNNLVVNDGIYLVYSGDVNQDGIIDLTDLLAIDNDNANFVTGYIVTDLNGDEIADLTDLLITDNNNAAFISKIIPGSAAKKPVMRNVVGGKDAITTE